jgi:O-antigen ligase
MRRVLGRLGFYLPAVVGLALPTLFIPTAEDSFILPRVSTVIAGACLGVGLALLAPGGPGLGRLRWPLIAASVAAILAFVFSISWPLSFAGSYTRYESLPTRLAYLGLFAMAVWLLRGSRPRAWVVSALVLGTAVACLEAIAQWAGHASFRPDGNLGNANLLAALIAMAIPLAIARGWRGDRFTLAWWLGVAVMAAGLVTTTSRSGGLGALAGCLSLLVFSLRGKVAAAAAVASTAVLAGAVVLILLSPLHLLNSDPAQLRIHLWQDGLHMIQARPFTGWGEDTTGLAFGHFLSGDWSPGVTFDRLHSGPLDIAATQGVVGLAAAGWLLLIVFRGAWRSRFSGDVRALAAACVGYSVWVLFNFDWAPATGAFWLLAGTAWASVQAAKIEQVGPDASPVSPANGPGVWRSSAAVAMALVAVALAVLPVVADVWYLQGRADLSVRIDPLQARYHWAVGQALIARGSVTLGVAEIRLAADLGETEPGLYVELGDREAQLGRRAEARQEYRRALEIDPYYAPAAQRLAGLGA